MMLLAALMFVGALGAVLACVWQKQQQADLLQALALADQRHSDQQRLAQAVAQWQQWQRIGETVIEESTHTVQIIHQSISKIPFDVLQQMGVPIEPVRQAHDKTTEGIYDAIRLINQQLGKQWRRAALGRSSSPK
jgi:hypothetical protein